MSEGRTAASELAVPREQGTAAVWRTTRRALSLEKPVVMGVLNVTPDSFSDGGRFVEPAAASKRVEQMCHEGADIIDVGGESTRPGARPVGASEELRRVLPTIQAAAEQLDVAISIDTTKAAVAREAIAAGAEIINDISGLRFDPDLAELAAESGAGLVLMHIRGEPRTMQERVHYDDLMGEIVSELGESIERARTAGCRSDRIVVDPGIGFGKTAEHNLVILNELARIAALGYPVLVGPSRKSFIGKTLGLEIDQRGEATLAACVVALLRGARVFRVHDVAGARRALDMAELIVRRSSGAEPD